MGELSRLKRTVLTVASAAGGLLATFGCAASAADPPLPSQGTPLAAMAGTPVVVLPVQTLTLLGLERRPADGLPAALDDSIAAALGNRGLATVWTFAPGITASARRNMGMTADPHALAAVRLRNLVKAGDDPLSEPLASQIRSLVALRDARYAILPALLTIRGAGAETRGSLLVYLIDARTARIRWSGDIVSDPSPDAFATVGRLAERLADLVVRR